LKVEFQSDELILALISLIRATDPRLLRQGPEGFTVDFEQLERKAAPSPDDRLLLKLHTALDTAREQTLYSLELTAAESNRLAGTLASLEQLQPWPQDVLEMSRSLRARLEGK
jgi:hypothetical protein